MSVETIDLTNYRDRTGSRVPEGDYIVSVEDIEIGESRKGDVMWTVYLSIVGGEYDGQTLVDRLTHTERALFRVVGFLQGMGVKIQRKRIRVDTARLVGKKVKVQVSDGEPYNGTVRSEIRGYERFVSKASQTDDVDELDDIADDVAEETPAPAKKAKKSKPAPEPVDEMDDEDTPETSDDDEIDLDDIDV